METGPVIRITGRPLYLSRSVRNGTCPWKRGPYQTRTRPRLRLRLETRPRSRPDQLTIELIRSEQTEGWVIAGAAPPSTRFDRPDHVWPYPTRPDRTTHEFIRPNQAGADLRINRSSSVKWKFKALRYIPEQQTNNINLRFVRFTTAQLRAVKNASSGHRP